MKNKVSVIIPTYKGSEVVSRAIESCINQTYDNIEIIVVDDNGEGTEEQIKTESNIKKYITLNKVKYIKHEKNKNGSAARNTGFKNSTGDFICLLDDDDEYLPYKVEKQVNMLLQLSNDWGMVYCGFLGPDKGKSGNILFDLLIHSCVIGSDSFMVRRNIWEKCNGFDESFRRHQDYEFTARVAAITKIKYQRFIGFTWEDLKRNVPKSQKQVKEYRTHYLNKMMFLINRLSFFQKRFVISCNALEVISKKNILDYKEYEEYCRQWINNINFLDFLITIFYKIFRKIKWKIKRNGIKYEK